MIYLVETGQAMPLTVKTPLVSSGPVWYLLYLDTAIPTLVWILISLL